MAVTLTNSGSLNTTLDNYGISVLSNTSSVNLGAVSLKFNVPGGVIVKDVNAGISATVSFLQKDKKLNVGFFNTGSNWTVNNGTLILSITASGMSTGSFTLDTDEDWYNEFASGSGDVFQNFDIKMPTLAANLTRVSDQLGVNSILSGINPTVNAPSSSVFGFNNTTTGTASFAEGVGTLASGFAAHAAGVNTTASGYAAFSTGVETDADGTGSFAMGSGSWARGTATVTMGIGTVASSSGQLVVGHYNEQKTDINNIFVVGDGTSPSVRRNIIEVYGGQGAISRGVKIDTAPSPTSAATIDGFQVYGKTNFWGPVTQSGNIISIGDTSLGSSASFIAEAYNSLPALEGRTILDWKGINFDDAYGATSPGSTFLWRNQIDELYFGSNALIQNNGNNTGAVGSPLTIGTINASNLQLETNNTTRVFISGSGNVGIGTATPSSRLQISGSGAGTDVFTVSPAGAPNIILKADATLTDYSGLYIGSKHILRSKNSSPIFFNIQDTVIFADSNSAKSTMNAGGSLGLGIDSSANILARLHARGTGATSATTALLVQNSTPTNLMTILDNGQFTYTTPTIILPASQSAYTISPVISASNVVGGQYYGVNITPTFFQTTGSQTETAFRVAATFTQSSAAATSGTNIIADFGASSVGSQFTITDVTSGSIYMVNDVSGLPIIEANSGWDVNIYNFPNTVFRKSGNNIELGVQSNTGSVLTFYADTILNEGYGFTYRTTQVSGSTSGAVTSSLWNITFGSVSSSVYVNAVVTGYDTASRDTITGDVKATIRYRSGVASIVGFNQSFSNTDNSDVSFNVVAGGTSGSLRVFGTGSRTYQWGATITTQVI